MRKHTAYRKKIEIFFFILFLIPQIRTRVPTISYVYKIVFQKCLLKHFFPYLCFTCVVLIIISLHTFGLGHKFVPFVQKFAFIIS